MQCPNCGCLSAALITPDLNSSLMEVAMDMGDDCRVTVSVRTPITLEISEENDTRLREALRKALMRSIEQLESPIGGIQVANQNRARSK